MATTLLILLAGMTVVVGGILAVRLHPFLALILGAWVVGTITPPAVVERHLLETVKLKGVELDPEGQAITVKPDAAVQVGTVLASYIADPATGGLREWDQFRVIQRDDQRAVALCEESSPDPWPERLIVVTASGRKAAADGLKKTIAERVATGFGNTCASIGILIALASIVGKCLLDSGGADRIVRSCLRLFGERSAPAAFLSSGFLLGIPVFFDTVFYLMIPLARALWLRTRKNYLLYVLAIVAGGTMTHSLVPPTPGPLAAAEALGVNLGTMILGGLIVGAVTASFGYLYAVFVDRRNDIPLRATPDITLEDLEQISERPDSELPPLWLSLVPILLPVVLIGGDAVIGTLAGVPANLKEAFHILGDKNVSLALAAFVSLGMVIRYTRTTLAALRSSVEAALASGGSVILITAGGGAFGYVLQQTGVSNLVQELPQSSPAVLLSLAFLLTTVIRTAQGSATVAMITAAGVLSGFAASGQLPFHPVYLALAIGCGSKPFAWMNDSGFWVICKMSGLTETEGLRFVSPMTAMMGVIGLGVTVTGAVLFPLM